MAVPVLSFFRTGVYGASVLGVLALGCASAHEADAGAARDAGPADAHSDASVDARAALDVPDVREVDAPPPLDAPPVPLDVPWVAVDAPRFDAPFVPSDAGPCAAGDYVLEGTPIALEPVTLGYPSTTGWRDVWRDPSTGSWEVHVVSDDLETVSTLGPLGDAPMTRDGFSYEPEATGAVDVAGGAMLVAFRPVASYVDHFLVAVYGLDGARRTEPVRIDVPVGEIRAAWTGSGYSVLATLARTTMLIGTETVITRVELDAAGVFVDSIAVPALDAGAGDFGYGGGAWHGVTRSGFGQLGGRISVARDGGVVRGPSIGGGAWTFHASAYSALDDHTWVVVSPYVVPGPPAILELDGAGELRTRTELVSAPAWLGEPRISPEAPSTVGLLFSTGTEHWFLRVRGGAVIQRLLLPRSPPGGAFLRFPGGRYAIGWGAFFDELTPCP